MSERELQLEAYELAKEGRQLLIQRQRQEIEWLRKTRRAVTGVAVLLFFLAILALL